MDHPNHRKVSNEKPAGLYIHVPFCLKKCPYCDFYSGTGLDLIPAYLSALKKEMALTSPHATSSATTEGARGIAERGSPAISNEDNRARPEGIGDRSEAIPLAPNTAQPSSFDTIYLGGGTPSLLSPGDIEDILNAVYQSFPLSSNAEITLEANPGTINSHYLKEIRAAGVNRINIGIQAFDDTILQFLGRIHSAREADAAIRSAREARFDNMGIDLIYGYAGQSRNNWIAQLHTATRYSPEHLSCYMLTIEPGTLFDKWEKRGKIRTAPESTLKVLFETTVDFLEKNGYIYYEISNFAKNRHCQSRHNKKYWSHVPYLGLGPSAHSFREPARSWNHRSLKKYLNALNRGERPMAGRETLDDEALMLEYIYLGLRTAEGISIATLNNRFNIDFLEMFAPVLFALHKEGNITVTPERCVLTHKGRLFCDAIAARIAI